MSIYDNIESMSDEEFMQLEFPADVADEEIVEDTPALEEETSEDAQASFVDEDTDADVGDEDDSSEEEDDKPSLEEATGEEEDESSDEEESESVTEEEESTDAEDEEKLSDAEKQMAELLKPFKANNRDIQVKDVDEARKLMQMGANYNKKMLAIKPLTRVGRMLEKNGLMDEEKLSYLIDLHNKNPEAISKLVADSGIDLLDATNEHGSNYKPKSYAPSDSEMVLEDVISQIESTDSYSKTVDVVTKQWDRASADFMTQNPTALIHLNEQISNGTFDIVSQEVEHRRMLGELSGISDVEAYKTVGEQLNAKANAEVPKELKQANSETKSTNSAANKATLAKKQRVAIPKKAAQSRTPADTLEGEDIFGMPDDEFDKLFDKKFR